MTSCMRSLAQKTNSSQPLNLRPKQGILHLTGSEGIQELLPVYCRATYHLLRMKVREILKLLRAEGWYLIVTEGSHRQFKHPTRPGRTTVSGHPSDDINPKTLKSILTQAGLLKK
jgi:predicted RNA binding protein YcfA (HicA-like mRNA interferase family)